jgi:mono/diheme cytochrome c family protein
MSRVITSTSKSLGERAAFDKRWRGGARFWRPRRVAAVIATLAAAAWLGVQAGSGGNQLYKPRTADGAHAQWEQNCNVCHGGGKR